MGTDMINKKLKEFYNFIAFGDFDRALELAEVSEPFGDEKERIVVQTLKLKKILQNSNCQNKV